MKDKYFVDNMIIYIENKKIAEKLSYDSILMSSRILKNDE